VRDVGSTYRDQKTFGRILAIIVPAITRWGTFSTVMAIQAAPERPCLLAVAIFWFSLARWSSLANTSREGIFTFNRNRDERALKDATRQPSGSLE
jgi:hypothetical protein